MTRRVSQKICPSCRTEQHFAARFCDHCGMPLASPGRGGRTPRVVAVPAMLGMAGMLAAVLAFLYQCSGSTSASPGRPHAAAESSQSPPLTQGEVQPPPRSDSATAAPIEPATPADVPSALPESTASAAAAPVLPPTPTVPAHLSEAPTPIPPTPMPPSPTAIPPPPAPTAVMAAGVIRMSLGGGTYQDCVGCLLSFKPVAGGGAYRAEADGRARFQLTLPPGDYSVSFACPGGNSWRDAFDPIQVRVTPGMTPLQVTVASACVIPY
jgi:hypothetical protein